MDTKGIEREFVFADILRDRDGQILSLLGELRRLEEENNRLREENGKLHEQLKAKPRKGKGGK